MATPSAFTWLRRGLTETVTPKGRLRQNLHRLEEPTVGDRWDETPLMVEWSVADGQLLMDSDFGGCSVSISKSLICCC